MMLMGLISGVGIQSETQAPAILCFIFICIPSAYIIGFVLKIGMIGIFLGQAIGQVILAIFYLRICYNIDWEFQVEESKRNQILVEG
jgi:Na+-driven multidrug efflux pump